MTGAGGPISLPPSASGPYEGVWEAQPRIAGGETLTISATGEDVPAFQGSLRGVTPVTLTSPVVPASGNLAVSTKDDVNFTWTGGTGGNVRATMRRGSGQDRLDVTCSFPDSTGSGTIPASTLAAFVQGSEGAFILEGGDVETMGVSGWRVSLVLHIPAVNQDESRASTMVTFE